MYLVYSSFTLLIPFYLNTINIIRFFNLFLFLSSVSYHYTKIINYNKPIKTFYIFDKICIYLSIFFCYLHAKTLTQQIIFWYSTFNGSCLYLLLSNCYDKNHGVKLCTSTYLHILMHLNSNMGFISTFL